MVFDADRKFSFFVAESVSSKRGDKCVASHGNLQMQSGKSFPILSLFSLTLFRSGRRVGRVLCQVQRSAECKNKKEVQSWKQMGQTINAKGDKKKDKIAVQ